MKTVKIWSLALAFVCTASIAAQAAVIDFESLAHDDAETNWIGAVYQEDGFTLTNVGSPEDENSPSFATFGSAADGFYTGSTALFNDNVEGVTWLTSTDTTVLFSLYSIDLSELFDHAETTDTVTFYGINWLGQTVEQTFTLDGLFGSETFYFSSDFTNLVSVHWAQTDYFVQFDNIATTAPVPEPSTLLLFGAGLIGLSAATKNRSTRN
nr:PEP-CTERM sorting domain-containing protein [uncultured Desulfobulbus sp.]